MNYPATSIRASQICLLCALLLALLPGVGCGPHAPPPGPVKPKVEAAKPLAAVPTNLAAQYVSVFQDLPPRVGKDPFFPDSHRRDPVPEVAATPVHVDPVLVLKAIMRTSTHSEAVINNEVMEKGDEEAIRIPSGHVRVRCLEIGEDYVLIQVDGEAEPKRLSMEQKK